MRNSYRSPGEELQQGDSLMGMSMHKKFCASVVSSFPMDSYDGRQFAKSIQDPKSADIASV